MPTEAPSRLAVFSDIHGNLHALQAVLEDIDRQKITNRVCCGDVVGYGAFPNECIAQLRFRQTPTLAGNHDHAAIDLTDITFFNEIARRAVFWTRERLTKESADWLRQRPFTYELGDCLFVHATPYEPEQWGYVLTFADARLAFSHFTQTFCFIGHSHVPAVVVQSGGELDCPEETVIPIESDSRYLVNVGSVGQPRDRNPQASWVEFDRERGQIVYHRVPYDVAAAQAAIRDAGLPDELAERLGYGW